MAADHLYSIAGGGDGSQRDGQPCAEASIDFFVFGLAPGPHGIAFTDGGGIRVEMVAR
ncbi:MAG TPA: hypothetical protein VFQ44_20035 [Streptosporangiaceae bacterium]|nr:hypothetical protein [Streptosporangiaceae bacterium]